MTRNHPDNDEGQASTTTNTNNAVPKDFLRPVLGSVIPATKEILDRSNIPFSFVMSPFARVTSPSQQQQSQEQEQEVPALVKTLTSGMSSSPSNHSTLAGSIARCQSCGATINPYCVMLAGQRFVCSICKEVNELKSPSNWDSMNHAERREYTKRYLSESGGGFGAISSYFIGTNASEEIDKLPELNHDFFEFDCAVRPDFVDSSVRRNGGDGYDGEPPIKVSCDDCPPLLIALVDLDLGPESTRGGGGKNSNIAAVCTSLTHALKEAPAFVRFGLFVFCGDKIGVFDLSSPYPHFKHFSMRKGTQLSDVISLFQAFPAIGASKMNVLAAIRALGDCQSSLLPSLSHGKCSMLPTKSFEVAVSTIFDFLENNGASHPGTTFLRSLGNKASNVDQSSNFFYAGGKFMTFLTSKPTEKVLKKSSTNTEIGRGGFGGSCMKARDNEHFNENTKTIEIEETGVEGVERDCSIDSVRTLSLTDDESYDDEIYLGSNHNDHNSMLGKRSVMLATAIEIFCLSSGGNQDYCFNLSSLRYISDRSGGCGPLVFDTSGHSQYDDIYMNDSWEGGTVPALVRETISRTPWHRPTSFGATLRIRTSPSYRIDQLTDDDVMSRRTSKGMYGSCAADQGENVWHFGTCSPETTICCDATFTDPSESIFASNSEAAGTHLPSIQIAFMYTSIIPSSTYPCDRSMDSSEDSNNTHWHTVRRLRVFTTQLNVVNDIEKLMHSIDVEALAVVLYHKIMLASIEDGLSEAKSIVKDWLISILHSQYLSAFQCLEGEKDSSNFQDGVINSANSISTRDDLLGQGHEKVRFLPLLVFALLQCNAFRPRGGRFRPTDDARIAAASSMATTSPRQLSRCITPTICIYSNVRNVELPRCVENLKRSALECIQSGFQSSSSDEMPFFIVDSPHQILFSFLSGSGSYNSDIPYDILRSIAMTYRVPPPIFSIEINGRGNWRLDEALVEDGHAHELQDFVDWCDDLKNELALDLNL